MKIKKNNKSIILNSGFSLVEMLIYVAILSVIMVIVVNTLILMTGSFTRLRLSKDLNISAINTLTKIDNEVKKAVSIDESLSIFNSSSGKLVLNSPNDSGIIEKIEFTLEAGVLKMKREGILVGDLTNKNSSLTNFTLEKIGVPTSGVKIGIGIETSILGETKSESFETSVNLRNY